MYIDEDELECIKCGRSGMHFDGDFDVVCPFCGAEYSLIDEDDEEQKDEEYDDEVE